MMKFQIYSDKAGEYRWRLRASNNQIIAVSGEGYTSKVDARAGIELVKGSSRALVEDADE